MSEVSKARTNSKAIKRILYSVGLAPFLLLFLIANLYFLADHPLVQADEPWLSDPPLQFSQTGHFAPSMFRGMHYNLEGKYRWSINDLLLASVFRVFGFGLYQARFVSFLVGILALLSLFLLGQRLYNGRVGFLATILFAFSPGYDAARIARPEILLTVLMLTVLYLCLLAIERDSWVLYSLSGLAAILAVNVHLNGLMVLAAGGILVLTRPQAVYPKARATGFYLLGVLVGGLFWLFVYGPLLTELEGSVFPPPDYWAFTWSKFKSYASFFHGGSFHHLSVASVLMLTSILALGIRRRPADKFLLTAFATFVPFYLFVFVNPHGLYLAYLFPILYLALSAHIDDLMQRVSLGKQPWTPRGHAAIVGVAMLTIALGLAMARGIVEVHRGWQQRRAGGYAGYIAKLRAYIPSHAVVMGQPTWFYGFANQPYYADRYFAWVSRSSHQEVRNRLGRSFEEAIAQAGVEYLIVDDQLQNRMSRENAINALPAEEVLAFLRQKCDEVGVVEDEYYGFLEGPPKATRIYKVTTPAPLAHAGGVR